MVMLDANMILRYLLNDHPEMADKAEQFLNAGNVWVTIEVIAEVVYVLKGVYSMERDFIADTVSHFLELVSCQEIDVLVCALDTYAERHLDFVDCVLAARSLVNGDDVFSFDKKLMATIQELNQSR